MTLRQQELRARLARGSFFICTATLLLLCPMNEKKNYPQSYPSVSFTPSRTFCRYPFLVPEPDVHRIRNGGILRARLFRG